jgi:F0F1-type ATP synthase assembly protein I
MSMKKDPHGADRDHDIDVSLVAITRQYAHYATVGIMFPVAIALGFFGGYMIDRWLGTIPLFALIGLGFGVAAAIRNLLQTVARDSDA